MAAAANAEIIRPLRRVEYDQLAKLGAFEDERIELLDGEMVTMSPIGTRHNAAVQELNELLVLALHGRATVRCQSSLVRPIDSAARLQRRQHRGFGCIEIALDAPWSGRSLPT